jgi:hypothetical protein
MKTITTLALGLAVASAALARPTETFSNSFATTATTFNTSLSFPKFDSSLGTLNSITFQLFGSVLGNAKGESLDASPATLTLTLAASLNLQRPDNTSIVVTIPTINNTFNATAFDGVIDFAGTSGITYTAQAGSSTNAVTLSGGSDLALFTGSGSIVLPVTGTGSSSGSGAGNLLTQFATSASASAQVTYNYSTATVPEPKVYGAIGAVACLGLLGYRRFRSQKA